MFGMPSIPYGMLGVAGGTDTRPTNTPEDMSALQKLYAATVAQNRTPNGRVARGFNQFGPQPTGPVAPMLPTPPMPGPVDMSDPPSASHPVASTPPALSAQAMAPQVPTSPPGGFPPQGVPMPASRPVDAPAPTPDMGFFARNVAMMRDPSSGAFIDPTAADNAQASGPDVINKLMSYFKNKDVPT